MTNRLYVGNLASHAESELRPQAAAIGESWVAELVHSLRSDDRDIVGEWPGTLGEARMRIRVAFRRHIDARLLDELARVANLAARRAWQQVCEPDVEL